MIFVYVKYINIKLEDQNDWSEEGGKTSEIALKVQSQLYVFF